MDKITKLFLLILFANISLSQTILPLPSAENFFGKYVDVDKASLYGTGQIDLAKLDVSSISTKFGTYYQPTPFMTVMIAINKGALTESVSSDSTDFNRSILFPENSGVAFSGGLYFTPTWIKGLWNDGMDALRTKFENIQDKIKKAELVNKVKNSDGTKEKVSYKLAHDNLTAFANFNWFQRTITKDTNQYNFSGWNFDVGPMMSWYYYTDVVNFRAALSLAFGYIHIANGGDSYVNVFRSKTDTSKTVPTSLRTLGGKVAVQFGNLSIAFTLKYYLGNKDNLIESLRGPQIFITTGVNADLVKF